MNIETMTMEQVNARIAEIRTQVEGGQLDLDTLNALDEEIQKLSARKSALTAEVEKRNEVASKIAAGTAGIVTETRNMETAMPVTYTLESKEYRNAWLKNLAKEAQINLGELSKEEREAFTHLTSNTSALVPTPILDRIVELVESKSPLLDDSTPSGMSQGFSIPRQKSIAQGDAAATNEGVANDDEEDVFDLLPLDGVEIKKHIVISRKMKFKSIAAFENWIVREIADRIANCKETVILTRLNDATYGIAASNVLTNQTYADATIRSIFAKIRGAGVKKVYANANTIWTGLAGITTPDGKPAFIPSAMENPAEIARLYGAIVVENNNIPDNVAYFGVPAKILANDYDELTLNYFTDPKTFEEIVSGYSLFDAGLENPLSFVKVTFQQEQGQ